MCIVYLPRSYGNSESPILSSARWGCDLKTGFKENIHFGLLYYNMEKRRCRSTLGQHRT